MDFARGMSPVKKGRRALVLGGGIAGLTAAGVLARHFEEVVLVERDRYSADPAAVRPHTPQGAQSHLLMPGGLVALSRLVPELPGWFDEMGRVEGDLTYHARVFAEGRWLPRARSGIPFRTCTRADVEHLVRRAAMRRENVRIVEGCKVEDLLGRERVRGARVSRGGAEEEMIADLVLDATGRSSSSVRWLAGAGVGTVEETTVDPGVIYTTAWFEPPAGIDDDWTVLATTPSMPHETHIGVAVRLAPGRMSSSVIEFGKRRPPRTHDEMIARMAALRAPEFHRLLRASKLISAVMVHGNTQNRWRRFGRLPRFPDGLVLLGDTVCSLNPRYGQGMTVAAMSVELLDRELSAYFAAHGGLVGFSRHFQKSLERALIVPWQIALLEDRAWVGFFAQTTPSLLQRFALAGTQRVLKAAAADVDTYIRFMRVAQMLDSPTAMLSPRTLAKIAMGGGSRGAEPEAPRVEPAARPPAGDAGGYGYPPPLRARPSSIGVERAT